MAFIYCNLRGLAHASIVSLESKTNKALVYAYAIYIKISLTKPEKFSLIKLVCLKLAVLWQIPRLLYIHSIQLQERLPGFGAVVYIANLIFPWTHNTFSVLIFTIPPTSHHVDNIGPLSRYWECQQIGPGWIPIPVLCQALFVAQCPASKHTLSWNGGDEIDFWSL